MINLLYQTLKEWKDNDNVAAICIEGAGDKAFCSGGDVRALYEHRVGQVEEYAFRFFATEYRMNMLLHKYPKPVLAYMNGYVMGGGVGISIGCSHRIVTESTKWAMPEMHIGFYPDVGGSYFLSRMQNNLGTYLALTSTIINGEDALHIGSADIMIHSGSWEDLKSALKNLRLNKRNAGETLDKLFLSFKGNSKITNISRLENKINDHFRFNTMEEIVRSLKKAAQDDDSWAIETLDTILSKSPTSQKVTLQQLINGKELELEGCFEMELDMSMNFMKCHDFFEGVRSVLVDKDKSPEWNPKTLEEINDDRVKYFFGRSWKTEKNPLLDLTIESLP